MTDQIRDRFLKARRAYIERNFEKLNAEQRKAVMCTEGPLLLLAGAGSGKTTVLINRIANILRFGRASDCDEIPFEIKEEDVLFLEGLSHSLSDNERMKADYLCAVEPPAPWNVIAITFTNKAANELKDRLSAMLGSDSQDVWAMTYHSACCRILRSYIDRLGYGRGFTIYDTSDSERLMKDIIKDMGFDDKTLPAKYVLSIISKQKDRFITPAMMKAQRSDTNDYRLHHIEVAYQRYQQRLKENNALDFDDIIFKAVELLRDHEDIRSYYQRKFRYVLVDEYQDTNHLQYLLTALLSGGYDNICVVGDDDQSIYRFRGATIENILDFETQYCNARVIRLEQNYRSTQSILSAANAVIAHNLGRKGKRLWTSNECGDPITVYEAGDEGAEAAYIAGEIIRRKDRFQDYAILYRTNAQSNALEFAFKRSGIPYRIIGGMRFFDRAEVKDMLAYLCVINNPTDDLRLRRIINNPPRGLGAKSLETAERLASAEGKGLYHIITTPESYASLQKIAGKFHSFTDAIEQMRQLLDDGMSLPDFYDELLHRSGYVKMLETKPTEENKTKLENIRELKSSINTYIQNTENPSLSGFLEEIALYMDIEQYSDEDDAVVMMTMHSAKGLEFPNVFLVGFEDGLFPGMRAIGDMEEMEEERRLCYVAITRAKRKLTVSYARQRMLYGKTTSSMPSRFLREIPENITLRKCGSYAYAERHSCFESYGNGRVMNYETTQRKISEFSSRSSVTQKTSFLELNKGDMVQHAAFGKGMVISVLKMGSDALWEIAFDQIGTKKLMAKTATTHIKRL